MASKPVVIIGAGFCGIISLKICIENGINAVCYDKTDNFGGLWRFRDGDHDGVASVQRSTIINTSKEINAMSDFPPPKETANYMHNSNQLKYLESYIDQNKLRPFIHYNHEIVKVDKSPTYEKTGEWTVTLKNMEDHSTKDIAASGVMVCIGHHVFPNIPDFPGQSEFEGRIIHSHSYKDFTGLERKRALVVGIGNSGVDVAVELSNVHSQVYLSTRRGAWVAKRVGKNGLPFDFTITRFGSLVEKYFPNYAIDQVEKQLSQDFDHALYNLKPNHRYNAQHPTMSDALPVRIIAGAITVKGDIARFTRNGVIFKGEEDKGEVEVDVVVFATGYDIRFPFLGEYLDSTFGQRKNRLGLYKRVFPPQLERPTLAIIGLVQPIGPIFPVAEMQARWAARVFKGECKLPSVTERMTEVHDYQAALSARYVDSQRHTIQVDMVPYMDDLAEKVGCRPNLIQILLTDPKLFWQLMFGPAVAYQYRLTGTHSWKGAREAILTVNDRLHFPFQTRSPKLTNKSCGSRCQSGCPLESPLIWLAAAILLGAFLYFFLG